jgi:predicted small metal-binding protein
MTIESVMAKMLSCDCGWTIFSPQGEGDVAKHAMIHVQDAHPGMTMTEDQAMKMMKSV